MKILENRGAREEGGGDEGTGRGEAVGRGGGEAAAAGEKGFLHHEEFMVGVAAVLAGAGVEERSRLEVLSVVERLVDRLQKAEQDKMSADLHIKGNTSRYLISTLLS